MRYALLALLLGLGGCISSQTVADTAKKAEPVVREAQKATPEVEATEPVPTPELVPDVDTVELMKQMFLVQQRLLDRILQMSSELTEEQLREFNEFLAPYGAQIKRKKPVVPGPSYRPEGVY